MKRNLKLTIEYDGSRYHGWQIQPNGVTIQEAIEAVLQQLTGERTRVFGSGRTDAGVHAEGQVAHFKTESRMDCDALQRGLNALLPNDIVVHRVEEPAEDFHARYDATGKTYRYVILNRSYPSAFSRRRCWHITYRLDLAAMEAAASMLVGWHNFSAFQASDCDAKHANRTVRRLDIRAEAEWITIIVSGDGFLKHMVRNMVGTLVEVGRGKLSAADVGPILEGGDRRKAGPTAPAEGLFLVSVDYA